MLKTFAHKGLQAFLSETQKQVFGQTMLQSWAVCWLV
jgi:hypothetical protein